MPAFAPEPLPPDIDPNVPSIARIYDYWLGGAHNFASDRAFAQKALAIVPGLRDIAVANRQFLIRATRLLSGEYGVTQFLDVGCGLPATSSVHEIARTINPGIRTVYVDNDPVAYAHGELLLAGDDNATMIRGDFLTPDRILADPATRALVDTGLPTAVLVVAVLHFVPDTADPAGILGALLAPFPPGSFLVFSHGTADSDPGMNDLGKLYGSNSTTGGVSRTHAEQAALLDRVPRLALLDPGLVWTAAWRPDRTVQEPRLSEHPERSSCYAAVGQVG